jgi:hypothetical protein
MTMRFPCASALLCIFLTASGAALAQSKAAEPAKPAAAAPPAQQQIQIEATQLIALIKSTIMALQQANQTGNYSVLRDMGTPLFRERFDQAKLTAIFSNLRQRNVNLTPVLFLQPNLTKQPEMTGGNSLHLVGDFPTQPLKIQYELLFLQIEGVWRIDGMAVDAVPVQPPAAASAKPSLDLPTPSQREPADSKARKQTQK